LVLKGADVTEEEAEKTYQRERTYYRLTKAGMESSEDLWTNRQYTLYPENGRSHQSKHAGWPHRKV